MTLDPRQTPAIDAVLARVFRQTPRTRAREQYVRLTLYDQRGLLTGAETHELVVELVGHEDLDALILQDPGVQAAIASLPGDETTLGSPWLHPTGGPDAPLPESADAVVVDMRSRGLIVTADEERAARQVLDAHRYHPAVVAVLGSSSELQATLGGLTIPLMHRALELHMAATMRDQGQDPRAVSAVPGAMEQLRLGVLNALGREPGATPPPALPAEARAGDLPEAGTPEAGTPEAGTPETPPAQGLAPRAPGRR